MVGLMAALWWWSRIEGNAHLCCWWRATLLSLVVRGGGVVCRAAQPSPSLGRGGARVWVRCTTMVAAGWSRE